jgi:hypothetical protein
VKTILGDYRRYYEAIRDAVRKGTPNPVTPEEALAVVEVLNGLHDTIRTN